MANGIAPTVYAKGILRPRTLSFRIVDKEGIVPGLEELIRPAEAIGTVQRSDGTLLLVFIYPVDCKDLDDVEYVEAWIHPAGWDKPIKHASQIRKYIPSAPYDK